jgi:hypothetical protein
MLIASINQNSGKEQAKDAQTKEKKSKSVNMNLLL